MGGVVDREIGPIKRRDRGATPGQLLVARVQSQLSGGNALAALHHQRADLAAARLSAVRAFRRPRLRGFARRVVDRGPGIPLQQWDQVFLPFQRLGDTDNTTGVGLGLALARGLTEAMGGRLDPEETPGGGLTMVISLPADPADVDAVAQPRPREDVEL